MLIAEASQPLTHLIAYLQEKSVYPPLTPLLLKAWMLVDHHEAWVRSYFVLHGILLCLLLYEIGRYLGGRSVGLTCLFAAAVSPMLVWASQFVRPYSDSAFWTVLAIYCLLRATDTKQARWWIGYALSALVAFYMFYYTALVVAALSVGMLFAHKVDRRFFGRWVAVHALILIAVVPWLGVTYNQIAEVATVRKPYWRHLGLTWGGFHLGRLLRGFASVSGLDPYAIPGGLTTDATRISWFSAVPPILGTVAFLWLLGMAWLRGGSLVRLLTATSVIPLGVGMFVDRLFSLPTTPKYLVAPHALALVAVVVGSGTCWRPAPFLSWFRAPTRLLGSGLGLASGVAIVLAFALRYPAVYLPEYDLKTAFTLLHQKAEPDDCVATLGGLPFPGATGLYHVAFNAYLDRNRETGMFSGPDERHSQKLADRLRVCGRVWSLEFDGAHETFRGNERLRVWLVRSGYHEVEVKRLIRVRLTLFVHPAPSR